MAQSAPAKPAPSGSPAPDAIPPRFRLSRMISSIWVPQAIHAAAELGIADALAKGARTADEVARQVGSHPQATFRLMRALVVLDIFRQAEDGGFELTELGRCLTTDAPDSVRNWALLWGGAMMWEPWGKLADCVKTGEMAPKLLRGFENPFDLMREHPEEEARFNQSMLELTRGVAAALPYAYDAGGVEHVVDVGGGFGALLPPLLKAHPQMRGTVFDLPHCEEGSRAYMKEEGLAERCDFAAGDFFEAVVPAGADLYVMKSVIHDWADEPSRRILTRCREAMGPESRLLVLEWIVPERVTPENGGIVGTDLNMLVMVGGRERTEREYRDLLESAGLRVTRILPTPAMSLIEAVRA